MAKKSVRWLETEINPVFFIPDGANELVYSDDEIDLTGLDEGSISPDDDVEEVITPNILGIESQVLRTTKVGNHVVDVTLLVEDIPGFDKYEVRITKRTAP